MSLTYDYSASKAFCEQVGLVWFGDNYQGLLDADEKAKVLGLSQVQVDELMRLHLWNVKTVITPKNYKLGQRIRIALHFLTGFGMAA